MIISLSDCIDIIIDNRGVTPGKRETEWTEKGVKVLSANNIKTIGLQNVDQVRHIPESKYSSWMKYPLEKGDIILTSEAPAGEVMYWDSDERVVLGQRLYGLKIKKGINSKYLKYYLQSNIGQKAIKRQQSGSTVFGISAATFKDIHVFLPENVVQDEVGEFLYTIDSKIENNNRIITELESMAKLIYDYWFVQFDFPDENGRPYKSSGGKMVWNDELKREIPEGWEATRCENVIDNAPKSQRLKTNQYLTMGKHPIIDQSQNYICGYTNNDESLININDAIVFGDHTKVVKYVNFPFARGADGTQVIISNNVNLTNVILYHQIIKMNLVSQGYSRYFKFLKDKLILVPSKSVSLKFTSLAAKYYEKATLCRHENQQLTSLRDFLLPLLMNGQVTIGENAGEIKQ